MTERALAFERLFNVRDLGGLRTTDGRRVRRGRVYRSDDPHLATEADVEALRDLRLATVIDLRLDGEVDERGSAAWAALGVTPVRASIMAKDPAPETFARYIDPEFVAQEYLAMLTDPELARVIWRALAAGSGAPTLVHGASGRDRTGVVCALLLEILGVDRGQVLADYEASGAGMARLLAYIDEHRPEWRPATEENRYSFVRTPAPCLAAFLDAVEDRWGSAAGYLDELGVQAEAEQLREALLEECP